MLPNALPHHQRIDRQQQSRSPRAPCVVLWVFPYELTSSATRTPSGRAQTLSYTLSYHSLVVNVPSPTRRLRPTICFDTSPAWRLAPRHPSHPERLSRLSHPIPTVKFHFNSFANRCHPQLPYHFSRFLHTGPFRRNPLTLSYPLPYTKFRRPLITTTLWLRRSCCQHNQTHEGDTQNYSITNRIPFSSIR